MVTQAPKRSAVFAAIAFTLSCIGLMIFVWTQFGGSVPFAPQGYHVNALFSETGLLVPNADVRIAGVNVGKVTNVQARGVNSYVTMDIDHQYAPIPVDTRAILREKTLLGEAYVELSTGNGAGPKIADDGTIPASQVQHTQQLDQVLGSFDTQTQHNLQAFLNGTYLSLAGQGQNLNDAIGNFDPTLTELSAVVGVLNQQQGNLKSLINNAATVLTTLGDRSADVQSLVTAGDQVLSATASRNTALTATVNALPPFLGELRTTLTTLNTSLGLAKPSLVALKPVAPLLTPALADLIKLSGPAVSLLKQAPGLLDDADKALPAITRFTAAFHPAVDAILPAAQQLAPVISFMGLYNKELVAAMGNLGAVLQAEAPANTDEPVGTAAAGMAHYIRAVIGVSNETVYGQTTREPNNRHNAYFSPGELANIAKGGLLSSDCNNIHNKAQVPILGTNVPCRVQPGFDWGSYAPTTKNSYYPHLTAAPK
jgi:phospholipid/cholesterol/gamma-HCH transport system substrate-binding protein